MPIETYKHNGSAFQLITEIQYTDDTLTDRTITEVHYNDNGTFRQVFQSFALSLVGRTITSSRNTIGSPGTATSRYQLTSDGIAQQLVNINAGTNETVTTDLPGTDWWTGKPEVDIGDLYEVRGTQTATNGNGTFSGTLGTFTQISSLQTWQLQDTGEDVEREATRTILIEIGLLGTSTPLVSASINLETQLLGP